MNKLLFIVTVAERMKGEQLFIGLAAKYKQNVQQYKNVSRHFSSVLLSFNENTVVQIKAFVNKMKIVLVHSMFVLY